MRFWLYFHTVKHLKLKQIFFRILRGIYRSGPSASINIPNIRTLKSVLIRGIEKDISLVGPQLFIFYGERGELGTIGWDGGEKEKIWRYNQHYFDDLNAINSPDRSEWHRDILSDWLTNNPVGIGVGWEPYPLSLRIVNWIKWELTDGHLLQDCRASLFLQGLVLEKNIEYHILGNHLFANAKALIFIGCYFEGRVAERWLATAYKIINQELKIQVLNDGGNFELSPMYHCIFLEDVLDLINLLSAYKPPGAKQIIDVLASSVPNMINWMNQMTFADGGVACFNDSATNIAASPEDIIAYARRSGIKTANKIQPQGVHYEHLVDSGYISVKRNTLKMIIDVAKLGPDYLLAHAHADSLAFELALADQRVFVNSGTSCYGNSKRRSFERSTQAHNSVEINGCSSSETWSSFRVARRAYPVDLTIDESAEQLIIQCSHTGYRRLAGSPTHTRSWHIDRDKIIVRDKISGVVDSATSRFILHSDVQLVQVDAKTFSIRVPDKIALTFRVLCGSASVKEWKHTTEFGDVKDTKCLEVQIFNNAGVVEII